jgi:hypothetical protein
VQTKIADASGHPPPNTIAARDEQLPRRIKENPIRKAINEVSRSLYLTPNSPSWTQGMELLTANLQRVLKGDLLPKEALADAQPKIQALLDEDLRRGVAGRRAERTRGRPLSGGLLGPTGLRPMGAARGRGRRVAGGSHAGRRGRRGVAPVGAPARDLRPH